MSAQYISNVRPDFDREIVDIVDVMNYEITLQRWRTTPRALLPALDTPRLWSGSVGIPGL